MKIFAMAPMSAELASRVEMKSWGNSVKSSPFIDETDSYCVILDMVNKLVSSCVYSFGVSRRRRGVLLAVFAVRSWSSEE